MLKINKMKIQKSKGLSVKYETLYGTNIISDIKIETENHEEKINFIKTELNQSDQSIHKS